MQIHFGQLATVAGVCWNITSRSIIFFNQTYFYIWICISNILTDWMINSLVG